MWVKHKCGALKCRTLAHNIGVGCIPYITTMSMTLKILSMKMYTRSCVNANIDEGNVHNNHVSEG